MDRSEWERIDFNLASIKDQIDNISARIETLQVDMDSLRKRVEDLEAVYTELTSGLG